MKFLKTMAAAATLAVGVAGIAGSAQAATFMCSPAAGTCTFDGTTGSFSAKVKAKTTTSDTFEIALASAGALTLTFTSGPVQFLSATFDGAPFSITKGAENVFNIASAGTYDLVLQLKNPAAVGSSYSGTIDFAAVPEPATWGMLLGGVALAGGALRRRRAQKPAIA